MPNRLTICQDELFDELFRAHSRDLFNFLYYKYGAESNPNDVVQEAFMKLWENCEKVEPEKVRAYLFTVGNNLMLNHLARQKTATKFNLQPQETTDKESPQFLMEEKELEQKINFALSTLTEDQRVTLMLNKVEGKKHKEIAEMLGISRKAVEKRIYKAIRIVNAILGDVKI